MEAPRGAPQGGGGKRGRQRAGEVWDGLRLIAASGYLLHVCLFLMLTAVVSSFFYFERAAVVASSVEDPVARRILFANINTLSAIVTLSFQLTLTGRLLASTGIAAALCAAPVVAFLGFAAISLRPTPGVVACSEALRKVVSYVLTRPGREVLFTVTTEEEKYKAKVTIDTLVQRLGDALAAGMYRVLGGVLLLGPASIAACAGPICMLWLAVGYLLGQRQQALARSLPTHLP